MAAPAIEGLLETCLYVDDMEAARGFYEKVMGLAPAFEEARITVYPVGQGGVLILFERGGTLETIETPNGSIPPHDGRGPAHFALAIPAGSLDAWRVHLADSGIAIEGEMAWARKGHSLYFRDPDDHLVELATPGLWPNR